VDAANYITFIHLVDAFIQLTIAIYVRGRTRLEQLGVKCLAQGHIGSHTVRFLIMPCFHCMSVLGKLKTHVTSNEYEI